MASRWTDHQLSLVPRIYEAALDPARWDGVVAGVCRAADAFRGELGTTDPARMPGSIGRHELPDALFEAGRPKLAAPVFAALQGRRMAGPSFTLEMLIPEGELRDLPLYREGLLPFGINSLCITALGTDGDAGLRFLVLLGGMRGKRLGRRAVRLANALAPHLSGALEIDRRLEGARGANAAAWDAVATSTILVDIHGEVRHANRSARRLLAEMDGLTCRTRQLHAATPEVQARLTALVARAAGSQAQGTGLPGGMLALPRPSGKPPLLASVVPVAADNPWRTAAVPVAAILFVEDPARDLRTPPAALRTLFGLTPTEARVAVALANGLTPADIAQRHGAQVKTVRTQKESIYAKLGVRSQVHLAKLLLRAEAILAQQE